MLQLTLESRRLISRLTPKKRLGSPPNWFLTELHSKLSTAFRTLQTEFKVERQPYVHIVENLKTIEKEIVDHLQTFSKTHLICTFQLDSETTIHLHLIYELMRIPKTDVHKYVKLVAGMLRFMSQYVKIPKVVNLYIYLSSLRKVLSHGKPLGFMNANTGFTYTNNFNVFIFREEEWFKVLIHECIHCFGLDNNDFPMPYQTLFPIESDFHVNEAYTEFWAEVINIGIFSLFSKNFSKTFHDLLCCEQEFKRLQMSKVLNHMQWLTYEDIIQGRRPERFAEETNIFCYYILATILLCSIDTFIPWCKTHNINLLNCRKTREHSEAFFAFFRMHYRDGIFLEKVSPHSFGKSLRMTCVEY